MTEIDLTKFKDRVGNRVNPGRYRVVVEDAEQDTAKSGNTMINLWLKVVGGEFDGAVIVDRLVLTENSLFRVVGFMQAIGMPTPKKRLQVNLQTQFVGRALDVDVEDGEPYNGRVKSEVRGYLRITKGEGAPADLVEEPTDKTEAAEEVLGSIASTESVVIDETVDLESIDLG